MRERNVFFFVSPGNIWTMTAVEAILNADDLEAFKQKGVTANRRLLESEQGHERFRGWKRPRITHTHVWYSLLPKKHTENHNKIIHITRNPKDVVVSYYYFSKLAETVCELHNSPLEPFLEAFLDGHVAWGSWFDYTRDWLKYKHEENILFIEYENFILKTKETIGLIGRFLGKELSEATVDQIADIISFDSIQIVTSGIKAKVDF